MKDKLTQKSTNKLSEEAYLIKMFKFADITDRGAVNFNEYCKVLEKAGMYYPPEQIKPLFESYDKDRSGSLDYKEFASAVFGKEVATNAYV